MFTPCVTRPLRRAFTLLELMVAIVVLGIAGALVIPSMSQTHVLRIQAAVRTVVADIVFIQSDALAYQSRRAIWFGKVAQQNSDGAWTYIDGNGYVVAEVRGANLDLATDALPDPQYPARPFSRDFSDGKFGGAAVSNVNFNGDQILIFDELGGPVAELDGPNPGTGGSLRISGSGAVYRIDVQAYTGRVVVTKLEDVN